MTEREWLTCATTYPMFEFLDGKASERKLRLLAVACCGWVTQLGAVTPLLGALDVAERYADGAATTDELEDAEEASNEVFQASKQTLSETACRAVLAGTAGQSGDDPHLVALFDAADSVSGATSTPVRAADATDTAARYGGNGGRQHAPVALLRDVFGNPFRSVTFDPAWRTSDVMMLANGIYAANAFDRMPILADALQDAGCDNEDILNHLRDTNATHVRGCWALDLVLGKE